MPMRGGVARVCITPPVGAWQGGYGARDRPCEGVHDDLFARALVLEDEDGARAAVVSVDVVTLTREVAVGARQRAQEMTGIPAGNIALCASHTHGGPATRAYGESGPQANEAYVAILEQYLAGVVAGAARELRPVALRLGRGRAGFNVNRRVRTAEGTVMRPNPEGVVDREVVVLRLDALDALDSAGEPAGGAAPLAILFRYTCHATAMGAANYLITADYPGAAAAFVEQAYSGQTLALFLQGCTGDVRPHLTTADGGFRSATWPELAQLGRELGGAVVAGAERAASPAGPAGPAGPVGGPDGAEAPAAGPLRVAGTTTLLPYAPPPSAAELRALIDGGRWPGPQGKPLSESDRRWAGRALEAVQAGGLEPGVPAEVQVLRLGGVWLVILPGEVFVEIGWRVRDAVAGAAGVPARQVVVAAYANGNVGYVPTAAAMPEGGYEVHAYRMSGRPSGYAPEAEEVLARTAADLAAGLAH